MRLLPQMLALAGTMTATPAWYADRYFVVVFGAQGSRCNLPRHSHVFASFIKVSAPLEDAGLKYANRFEVHTISWMPASGKVRIWRGREAGVNLTLEETLARYSQRGTIVRWGPYEAKRELYERALRRKAYLESGRVAYRCLDSPLSRNTRNCIHALSGVVANRQGFRSGLRRGPQASLLIVRRMEPFVLSGEAPELVAQRLNLKQYTLQAGAVPAGFVARSNQRAVRNQIPVVAREETATIAR